MGTNHPQKDFTNELEQLMVLCEAVRDDYGRGVVVTKDSPSVLEYNRILDKMLEEGFRDGLEVQIEIPSDLISNKYLSYIRSISRWMHDKSIKGHGFNRK